MGEMEEMGEMGEMEEMEEMEEMGAMGEMESERRAPASPRTHTLSQHTSHFISLTFALAAQHLGLPQTRLESIESLDSTRALLLVITFRKIRVRYEQTTCLFLLKPSLESSPS
jgi:hypothetical protein